MLETAVTLPFPSRTPPRAWLQLGRVTHLQWSPYTLTIPDLPPALVGLRVLHLTDLHIIPTWMPAFDALHARIAASPPDLILISGDFVDSKHNAGPAMPNVHRFIAGLKARLGIYGTIGNHDGDVLPVLVGDWPVRMLYNETATLTHGDTTLDIIGLHGVDPADASARLLTALPTKGSNTLRLVMAHFPHQATLLAPGVADVVMTGHTHGGQICLPNGWPPITHEPLPRRFAKGVHWLGDRWLVVGRGMGFSKYRVRAFCPAEAIELTLVPG